MKLAAMFGPNQLPTVESVVSLEDAGFHSFWTAEDWGADAVSQLAWVGSHTTTIELGTAILQAPGRSPAMTAMTAATLAELSGGRFLCGIGPSGPQVVEGWHGVAYGQPLARLREYVSIVRDALARDEALTASGEYYELPLTGDGTTGLGKSLRLNIRTGHNVPVYVSALGPRALELGGEIADGVIAGYVDPGRFDLVEEPTAAGLARAGRSRDDYTVVTHVWVSGGPDVDTCRDQVRPAFARTIGGYGARQRNFYLDQVTRVGWGDEAARIQELFLAGQRAEAVAAVSDEMLDTFCLLGPPERIAERLDRYRAADVVMLGTADLPTLLAVAAAV